MYSSYQCHARQPKRKGKKKGKKEKEKEKRKKKKGQNSKKHCSRGYLKGSNMTCTIQQNSTLVLVRSTWMQNSFNIPLELAVVAVHLISNPIGIIGDLFHCPPHPAKVSMGLCSSYDPSMQQFLGDCIDIYFKVILQKVSDFCVLVITG